MAHISEPRLPHFCSPVLLVFPDGNEQRYDNGKEIAEQDFDGKYRASEIRAVDEHIEMVLEEIVQPQRELNSEWIFQQGCAFSDCVEALDIQGAMKYDIFFPSHTHAAVSLSAFACELFLKCLLNCNDLKADYIHDLKKLWDRFRKTDITTANEIEEYMEKYFDRAKTPVFDEKLKYMSNAFEDWRYSYEGKELISNRNFIIAFRQVLKNTCCLKLYGMTWKNYVEESTHREE